MFTWVDVPTANPSAESAVMELVSEAFRKFREVAAGMASEAWVESKVAGLRPLTTMYLGWKPTPVTACAPAAPT